LFDSINHSSRDRERIKYVKVDIGDGGISLKSIADASCSFWSNIVGLYCWLSTCWL